MESLKRLRTAEPLTIDDRRAAHINRIIANFIFYGALVYTTIQLLLIRTLNWRSVAPLAAAALMVVVFILLNRQQVRRASLALSIFVWLSMVGVTVLAGIDQSPGVSTFMVAVMTSALLLGIRAAVVTTAGSLLLSVALYVLEATGLYRPPVILEPELVAAINAGFLLLVGVLLVVSLSGLNDATNRARASEERLRLLLNALPDALLQIDRQGRVLEAFARAATPADGLWSPLVGRWLQEGLPADLFADVGQLLEPAGPDRVEITLPAAGAAPSRRFETRAASSGDGEFLLLFRDVTDLRAAEAERARLARILDETPDMVGMADADGRVLYINRGGREMLDLGDMPVTERPYTSFYPPDVARRLQEVSLPQARRQGIWSGETRILTAGGRELIVSQVILAHVNEEDGSQYFSTVARDISARRAAERQQARLLRRLQILADIDRAIIGAESLRDTIDHALRQLRDTMGYHRAVVTLFTAETEQGEVFATSEDAIRVEQLSLRHVRPWLHRLEAGEPLLMRDMHTISEPTAAETAWLRQGVRALAMLPLRYRGQLLGTLNIGLDRPVRFTQEQLSVARDVADHLAVAIQQARLNEQAARYAAELEKRVAEMERFTYTVSHDLKSPLITIQGFLGFLQRDVTQGRMEQVAQDIAFIREAADNMQILLNDLLMLSRIGRVAAPSEPVPLTEVVAEAVEIVGGQLRSREIEVEVDSTLPVVDGDRQRLRELFQNLLENAAKFMGNQPQPRVVIGQRDGGGETIFFVADNGIGIEPRFHDKIFGLFEKLDPDLEGSGVGLALVKRIVEVHGGNIWVESAGTGHGATFFFTLPGEVHDDHS